MSDQERIKFPHGIPNATAHEGEVCIVTMRYRIGEGTPEEKETDRQYHMPQGWKYDDLIDKIMVDVEKVLGGRKGIDRIFFINVITNK